MSGTPVSNLPDDATFKKRLARRQQRGKLWKRFFFAANLIAIGALIILFATIVNEAFGLVAIQAAVDPASLADRPLDELSADELTAVLGANTSRGRLASLVRDEVIGVSEIDTSAPVGQLMAGKQYPAEWSERPFRELAVEEFALLLELNMSRDAIYDLVVAEVVQPEVVASWPLSESLFNRAAIEAEVAEEFPAARLEFHSWINGQFLSNPMSSTPADSGIRTALLGSLWMLLLTVAIAFPIGTGAAIYLEEYAADNRFNRLIETNIRNLAGVPSIIYGMLGLAIFVRALEQLTSGAFLGVVDSNGRTIISASLTMAVLILPVIIINAQEAIRAVPSSIREASYGLGATKWQTIWRQVLPAALPGIMTGMILSLSRAIGETAPLIVVGASTYIVSDPNGPFSKFTALPIQIYQWTARPQDQFRDIAAAGIIVLLGLLLVMNATAIIIRQRFSRRLY